MEELLLDGCKYYIIILFFNYYFKLRIGVPLIIVLYLKMDLWKMKFVFKKILNVDDLLK